MDIGAYMEEVEGWPIPTPISPFPRNMGPKGTLDSEGLIHNGKFYRELFVQQYGDRDVPNLVHWFVCDIPGIYLDRWDLAIQSALLTAAVYTKIALQMANELKEKPNQQQSEWYLGFIQKKEFNSNLSPLELVKMIRFYVARASYDAEAYAMSDVIPTGIWVQDFKSECGFAKDVNPGNLMESNMSLIHSIKRGETTSSTQRHIRIRSMFTRQFIESGKFELNIAKPER